MTGGQPMGASSPAGNKTRSEYWFWVLVSVPVSQGNSRSQVSIHNDKYLIEVSVCCSLFCPGTLLPLLVWTANNSKKKQNNVEDKQKIFLVLCIWSHTAGAFLRFLLKEPLGFILPGQKWNLTKTSTQMQRSMELSVLLVCEYIHPVTQCND